MWDEAAAVGKALGCCLTWGLQGHKHKGLGLLTLNGVKRCSAPADTIALLVVEGNCSRLELKGSDFLTTVGSSWLRISLKGAISSKRDAGQSYSYRVDKDIYC